MKYLEEYLVGYVCISSSKFSSRDIEEIRTTKAYTELLGAIQDLHLPISEDCIAADVIVTPNRKRWKLEAAIDSFIDGENRFLSPKGVLVIYDLAALGTKKEIVQKNYLMLIRRDIGVLILDPDNSEFSTVAQGTYDYCEPDPAAREAATEKITDEDIKTKRGKNKSKKEISDEFKYLYWMYENYYIPESVLFNSGVLGTSNRVTYNRYSAEYEHSAEYPSDEEKHSDVWEKPKRHGTTPKNLAFYIEQLNSGNMSTEEVCRKLRMTPITLHRFELKGYDRSAMAKATYDYKSEEKIQEVQAFLNNLPAKNDSTLTNKKAP